MELKTSREPGAVTVLTFELGNGFTVQNINELVILKEATDMEIEPISYVYDLQRTQINGAVSTEMKGLFKIVDDVS